MASNVMEEFICRILQFRVLFCSIHIRSCLLLNVLLVTFLFSNLGHFTDALSVHNTHNSNIWQSGDENNRNWMKEPSVFVAILIRNKAHTLPWFLYYLQQLDYPKQRMRLWIRTDHNEDNSVEMVSDWLAHVAREYNHVDFVDNGTHGDYPDSQGPFDWSALHMKAVIGLRQEALNAARSSWADFLLFMDADNFLTNRNTLRELIQEDRSIIAPMLNVTASEQYSNFWCGFDANGYYQRTDDYLPIRERHNVGVHSVALVHSIILIQLRDPATLRLAYDPPPPAYHGPTDDLIILAHSAIHSGVQMSLVNKNFYGYMLVPLETHNTLDEEREQFVHTRLESIVLGEPLVRLDYIKSRAQSKIKLGMDQIYMINLERRPDRKLKMEQCFEELHINATYVKAVDGRELNDTYLKSLGIKMMEGYLDPHGGRQMTMGEIGCFLSHYNVWKDVLAKGYKSVIVFEDDVRFRPYFPQRFSYLMHDLNALQIEWDLVYLGRKRLYTDDEPYAGDSRTLVWPLYSYWTLSYMLSHRGARKLMDQKPLSKLVPVDEFLPIMFNQHPQDEWKRYFGPRDLVALSAYPLLVEPTHYTGEPGYITDTENSSIIDNHLIDHLKGDPASQPPSSSNAGLAAEDSRLGVNMGDEL